MTRQVFLGHVLGIHVNSSWNRDSDRRNGKEPLNVVFLARAKWQKLNFLPWKGSPRVSVRPNKDRKEKENRKKNGNEPLKGTRAKVYTSRSMELLLISAFV